MASYQMANNEYQSTLTVIASFQLKHNDYHLPLSAVNTSIPIECNVCIVFHTILVIFANLFTCRVYGSFCIFDRFDKGVISNYFSGNQYTCLYSQC